MSQCKPRTKIIHGPIRAHAGYVAIGSGTDFHVQMEDEDGSIETLLRMMDGSRTKQEVIEEMKTRYPHLSANDILEGIEQFDQAGYLENAEQDTRLQEHELSRYRNNLNFFSVLSNLDTPNTRWQEKIQNLHVCVLGLGGVGSSVAQQLCGLGIGKVTILDRDTIELRNLNRQFLYSIADIGKSKVEVAEQKLRGLNDNVAIEAVEMYLDSSERIREIIRGSNLIISCVDSPVSITQLVNEACVQEGIPYLSGGFRGSGAAYFSVIPGVTGCYDCLQESLALKITDFVEQVEELLPQYEPFLQNGTGTGMGVGILSGLLTLEALRILLGIAEPIATNKSIEINFLTGEIKNLYEWSKMAHCKVCGCE